MKPLNALETALVQRRSAEFLKLLHSSPVVLAGRLAQDGSFEASTYRSKIGLPVLPVFTHKDRAQQYVKKMNLEEPFLVQMEGKGVIEGAVQQLSGMYVNVFEAEGMWLSPDSVTRIAKRDFDFVDTEEKGELPAAALQ